MNGFSPVGRRIARAFLLGGISMFLFPGCQRPDSESASEKFASDRDKNPKKNEEPPPDPKRVQFAEDRAASDIKAVAFDGKRAMAYLKSLCDIGPRISASDGMKKQRDLLVRHFEKHGAKVVLQKFDGKQASQKNAVPMVNLIVSWHPEAKRRIILCGHYDTRPIADQEERERDWRKPFASANDGTSTVAFLMELAHHMKDVPVKVGVDFVIFDGEEFINDRDRDKFFLGSDYFADRYKMDKPAHKYAAAVLLDLFAGKDATFRVDGYSLFKAGEIVESIWAEAKTQGAKSFIYERANWHGGTTTEVQDDHLALNRVGIPAVDIIDFDYPHWHKLSDLPEQCSGDKMAEVAKVLTAWMQRVK
jgi:glutaminyl-peptide cyclotransferase